MLQQHGSTGKHGSVLRMLGCHNLMEASGKTVSPLLDIVHCAWTQHMFQPINTTLHGYHIHWTAHQRPNVRGPNIHGHNNNAPKNLPFMYLTWEIGSGYSRIPCDGYSYIDVIDAVN